MLVYFFLLIIKLLCHFIKKILEIKIVSPINVFEEKKESIKNNNYIKLK